MASDERNPQFMLHVAEICPSTRALGPGVRAALWVQGCCFSCPGCVAPNWIPQVGGRQMLVEQVVDALLIDPFVSGLTISGGEPMLQAPALLNLIRCARKLRDLNIICFTGFTLKKLTSAPRSSSITSLLEELDVLIDGPYVQSLDDNRGMRGSSNQRVHHLSGFLQGWDFENLPRRVELQFGAEYALLVGVPPLGLVQTFDSAVTSAVGGYSNVRT